MLQLYSGGTYLINKENKMAYTAKDPRPPTAFSVPNRNKKLEGGEEGEGENVHLKTHATARGVG